MVSIHAGWPVPNLLLTSKQKLPCTKMSSLFWCQWEVGNNVNGHPVFVYSYFIDSEVILFAFNFEEAYCHHFHSLRGWLTGLNSDALKYWLSPTYSSLAERLLVHHLDCTKTWGLSQSYLSSLLLVNKSAWELYCSWFLYFGWKQMKVRLNQ